MATLRVSNQAQLDAAVRQAGGGDTIMLASGSYADLDVRGVNKGQVTITSASAGDPAVIRSMLVKDSSGITVRNVELQSSGGTPFVVDGSRNVTIDDVEIQGRSGGFGTGIGLRVKNSQGVALTDSEVSHFSNGLSFSNNSNVRISNNDFRSMSTDAMQLGGIKGGVIDGNDFRDMHSPDASRHKDMIQFVTGGGNVASSGITIRNNVIDNGEVSHAIFFGNALAKGGNLGAFYRDILIEDNYIRSAHVHGVTIDHGAGVTIRDNTLVSHSGGRDINIPLINVSKSSIGVTIQGNKVASVPDGQGGWNISGNVVGSRDLDHWQGAAATLRASSGGSYSAPRPSEGDGGSSGGSSGGPSGNGVANAFGVSGSRAGADFTLRGVDFSEGDTIVFRGFDRGTFEGRSGGNPLDVWNGGYGARVNALEDLKELAAMSSDVSARTSGDLLVLEIEQGRDEHEVRIEGWGQEFRSQPDLF